MKKRSVKMKITLWYAGIILILTAGLLVFTITFSEKLTWNKAEGNLKDNLRDFMENIELNQNGYTLEDDTEFYEDGISFSIYDSSGKLTKGIVPVEFPSDTVLKNGKSQTISHETEKWLTYDEAVRIDDTNTLWIRAVASAGDLSSMGQILLMMGMISFPVLAVLSIAGGYYVTGKALKPVEEALIREHTFTSDASHELRTPVSVIMSESEYALLPDCSAEEKAESLQVILSQAKHMSGLISQLLTLARSDADSLTLAPLNISDVAGAACSITEESAVQKNIRILPDIQPNLMINGEESSLMRMFINLLDNSVRYGKDGGFIKISLYRSGHGITGTITDNGTGISAEHLPRIWERFYQAKASRTKDGYTGHGLGLSMVQWVVSAHHGSIRAESEPGQGTTFTFVFPSLS